MMILIIACLMCLCLICIYALRVTGIVVQQVIALQRTEYQYNMELFQKRFRWLNNLKIIKLIMLK